jgi:hypothetical protein
MTGTWISKHSPTIRSDTSYPLERYLARFNELEFDPQAGEMVVIRRLIASRTTRASAAALTGDLMHFLRWARDRGSVFELTYDDAEDYVAAMTRRRYAGSTRLQRVSAARGPVKPQSNSRTPIARRERPRITRANGPERRPEAFVPIRLAGASVGWGW